MTSLSLKQMSGQDKSGLDAIYANLAQQLTCDSECQKRMNIDELREKWKVAQTYENMAPEVTFDAEKNYLIASEGIDGYHNTMLKRYTTVANTSKDTAIQAHNEFMSEITTLNDSYNAGTNSLTHIKDLLNINLSENSRLTKSIDQDVASVQTNDRKVVYEEWAKKWLYTVNKALKWIYIFIAIVFIYKSPFISNSTWKTFTGWMIPIILFIFPYIVYYIALFIVFVYKNILWFMQNKAPKNVYSQL